MSWFNYDRMKRLEKLTPEEDIAVQACQIFASEGYFIKSITNNYKWKHPKFRDFCEFSHPNGFDLILLNDDFNPIGVEVKRTLSLDSYQQALGQCINYYCVSDFKYKEVIIFAREYQSEDIFEKIQNYYDKVLKLAPKLPLKIRTMRRTKNGYHTLVFNSVK